MISFTDLEVIESIIKWNGSRQVEVDHYAENIEEENLNTTKNVYQVVMGANDWKPVNTTDACNDSSNLINLTDLIGPYIENKYDSVEIAVVIILFLLIVVTVIGNTLIISAVLTTKRLRTVTNCFVTSLAVADLLVGIFVMPPAIAVHITGKTFITL